MDYNFAELSNRQKRRRIQNQVAIRLASNTPPNEISTSSQNSEDVFINDDDIIDRQPSTSHENINTNNFESINDRPSEENFSTELIHLIIKYNISHSFINDLLLLLKKYSNIEDLPKDVRTLLNTKRNTSKLIIKMDGGHYVHFGVEKMLKKSIQSTFQKPPKIICINFNIDGLPISKSAQSQFWPILGSIVSADYPNIEPFPVGIYHGNTKPKILNNYLLAFVEEMKDLLLNGIVINNNQCKVSINAFVCDSPARAFISCVKGHTGYFGCSKCITEGEFIDNRVVFNETDATLRSDKDFSSRMQEEHHVGSTILESLNVGMVTRFPLDYMHLVCLGVMKRLLVFWLKGKCNIRLKNPVIEELNQKYISLRPFIPKEFARKPRHLSNEIERFKATEFRQIVLYTGSIVFKNILPKKIYKHFLCLTTAIRILCNNEIYIQYADYAESLLKYFVKEYAKIYGEKFISYNVHNLIHLANDSRCLGTLDSFSAFQFENYLFKLKNKIKNNGRPLEQITNRILEKMDLVSTLENTEFPQLHFENNKITKVTFRNFILTSNSPNNCVILENGRIGVIESIFVEEELKINICCFDKLEPYFTEPCDSKKVGIYAASKIGQVVTYSGSLIKKKCIKFNVADPDIEFVVVELLHGHSS